MKSIYYAGLGLFLTASSLSAEGLAPSITSRGIEIDAGSMGVFALEPPVLTLHNAQEEKPSFTVTSKTVGTARYSCGAELEFQVKGAEVSCTYKVPDEAMSFMFRMVIPLEFKSGGKFAFGRKELSDFPEEPSGQFVTTGDTRGSFTLVDAKGNGFTVDTPTNWYGLQDNRIFKWPVFTYQFLYGLKAHPESTSFTITVEPYKNH